MEINSNSSTINSVSHLNKTVQTTQQDSPKIGELKQQSGSGAGGGERVELSQQSRELSRAFSEFKKLPEIREEKVGEIQNQLETESYNVDNNKVAGNLLKESLENNAILNAIDLGG